MKKIILSATVAAMALTTTASALEDIKVNGQAKVWYETNKIDSRVGTADNEMFSKNNSSGEVVFKLGMTGKQGNVGFGATVYQTSSMGLEKTLVSGVRTAGTTGLTHADTNASTANDDGEMYTGEMYITVPVGAKTLLKVGKQELDTPLAFTERWNATPNTFNAAVAINNSVENLTLIAAYIGQGARGEVVGTAYSPFNLGSTSNYGIAALYKNNGLAVNAWYYDLNSIAAAYWIDAGMTISGINVKAYAAMIDPAASISSEDTKAYALSASTKVSGINLFAAGSRVSDQGAAPIANTATGGKKTKLPTAGVYTDGLYVAQMGSKAIKLKASGKLGTTGYALQFIDNSNGKTATLETTEIDLILSQKVGDVNFKAILMDRSFDQSALDATTGGQHVRVIASVNF